MGLFKQVKDMKQMVSPAPEMIAAAPAAPRPASWSRSPG